MPTNFAPIWRLYDFQRRQVWAFSVPPAAIRCTSLGKYTMEIEDTLAANAFRRLVAHLQHRSDAQNVDLMGLAGFCRNCLGDWLSEASDGALTSAQGREFIYGMPYAEWKSRYQQPASAEQLARMQESLARNPEQLPNAR
jgi:hypothetical protein